MTNQKLLLCAIGPLLFLLSIKQAKSQNIPQLLHLNENDGYKTRKPRKIIQQTTSYDALGPSKEKNILLFDRAGMLLSMERSKNNDGAVTIIKVTYTNDTIHRIVLKRTEQSYAIVGQTQKPVLFETTKYKYDAHYLITDAREEDESGKTIQRLKVTNNEQGNPASLVIYDQDGNNYGSETAIYFYDKNKAVTTLVSNNGHTHQLDTVKISFRNASKFPWANEKYNDNGDIIKWVELTSHGRKVQCKATYEYDSFGNCTNEVVYEAVLMPNGELVDKVRNIHKMTYIY